MICYNAKKYQVLFNENEIRRIEEKYRIKCLYGGFVGSNVYGTANASSDYDFDFVYYYNDPNNVLDKIHDTSLSEKIDFNGFNLDASTKKAALCIEKISKFPSFYSPQRCGPTEDIEADYLIFTSDYIWDSGYLANSMHAILNQMYGILILDHYFNRAAGNLEKNLSKDFVSTKRVIQTVLGINSMEWILADHTFPYLSFSEMTRLFHCNDMANEIFKILEKHQSYQKSTEPSTIPCNKELNTYLYQKIKDIEKKINKLPPKTFRISISPKSFIGKNIMGS